LTLAGKIDSEATRSTDNVLSGTLNPAQLNSIGNVLHQCLHFRDKKPDRRTDGVHLVHIAAMIVFQFFATDRLWCDIVWMLACRKVSIKRLISFEVMSYGSVHYYHQFLRSIAFFQRQAINQFARRHIFYLTSTPSFSEASEYTLKAKIMFIG